MGAQEEAEAVSAGALDPGAEPEIGFLVGLEVPTLRTENGSDRKSGHRWRPPRPTGDFVGALRWPRVCLLLILALLVAPASAQAAFSFAGTLSTGGQNAAEPQVAADSNGDAVFVWTRFDGTAQCGGLPGCRRIQSRARGHGGALSAIQLLSDSGQDAFKPQVAVNPAGDAVFVWVRFDGTTQCGGLPGCQRIQSRTRSASGTLSAVQTLSAAGQDADDPQVGIDGFGRAVFVWERPDGGTQCHGSTCRRIEGRVRFASGTLGTVLTLSAAGQDALNPQIGVSENGDAVFAWERADETTQCAGGPCSRIQARAREPNGALSATQTLSPAGQHAFLPRVAADVDGDAAFIWVRSDGTTACGGGPCQRIQARTRSSSGALSTVQTLSAGGGQAFSPQVVVDSQLNQGGSGHFADAVFAWVRNDATTQCLVAPCPRIQARGRRADGALGTTVTLSPAAGGPSSDPRIAGDGLGNAVFVWRQIDSQFVFRIQARSRSAAGALSATETISPAGQDASFPAVSADPNGGADPNSADAVAAWSRLDGTSPPDCCDRIQAAAQIASAPS